jgi:hypothetical protein
MECQSTPTTGRSCLQQGLIVITNSLDEFTRVAALRAEDWLARRELGMHSLSELNSGLNQG